MPEEVLRMLLPCTCDNPAAQVVDAGYGQVALHNHIVNRFMKMDHEPWAFESKSPRPLG